MPINKRLVTSITSLISTSHLPNTLTNYPTNIKQVKTKLQ